MDPYNICRKLCYWIGIGGGLKSSMLHPFHRMYSMWVLSWHGGWEFTDTSSPFSCRLDWGQRDPKLWGTSLPQHSRIQFLDFFQKAKIFLLIFVQKTSQLPPFLVFMFYHVGFFLSLPTSKNRKISMHFPWAFKLPLCWKRRRFPPSNHSVHRDI